MTKNEYNNEAGKGSSVDNSGTPQSDIFGDDSPTGADKVNGVLGNFKTAMQEMWSGKQKAPKENEVSETKAAVEDSVAINKVENKMENKAENKVASKTEKKTMGNPFKPAATPDFSLKETPLNFGTSQAGDKAVETAIITADLVIEGSVSATNSNIKNSGVINGNVSAKHDITSNGVIKGNVCGNNVAFIETASTVGNVEAVGKLTVADGTLIIGDVIAKVLEIDGRIKGNLDGKEAVFLKGNAVIMGNITGKAISIEQNAIIKGNIDVACGSVNEAELFDENKIYNGYSQK